MEDAYDLALEILQTQNVYLRLSLLTKMVSILTRVTLHDTDRVLLINWFSGILHDGITNSDTRHIKCLRWYVNLMWQVLDNREMVFVLSNLTNYVIKNDGDSKLTNELNYIINTISRGHTKIL